MKAFHYTALDHLLKPFDSEGRERPLASPDHPVSRPPPKQRFDRIVIREGDRIFFQRVDEIDYVEASNYKVRIHVGNQVREVRETLSSLEERLDPERFVRIHRGVIVNIDRIRELQPSFNGAYVVILEDGTELRLSRRRRDALEDLLGRSI